MPVAFDSRIRARNRATVSRFMPVTNNILMDAELLKNEACRPGHFVHRDV